MEETNLSNNETPTKRLYIETVGCQMNVLDSEMVVASLRRQGYSLTRDLEAADTILFNTCSVRENAEEKVYGSLTRLKRLKERFPEKVIGVMGCMAQKDQKARARLLARARALRKQQEKLEKSKIKLGE